MGEASSYSWAPVATYINPELLLLLFLFMREHLSFKLFKHQGTECPDKIADKAEPFVLSDANNDFKTPIGYAYISKENRL